jgi:hypothetical protein
MEIGSQAMLELRAFPPIRVDTLQGTESPELGIPRPGAVWHSWFVLIGFHPSESCFPGRVAIVFPFHTMGRIRLW